MGVFFFYLSSGFVFFRCGSYARVPPRPTPRPFYLSLVSYSRAIPLSGALIVTPSPSTLVSLLSSTLSAFPSPYLDRDFSSTSLRLLRALFFRCLIIPSLYFYSSRIITRVHIHMRTHARAHISLFFSVCVCVCVYLDFSPSPSLFFRSLFFGIIPILLSFFPIFLSDTILVSPPSPLHSPRSSRFSLARDQRSLPCFLLRSLPSALLSRFISFFHHPPLRHARTHVHTVLSLSLSHRSLSLRRRMSPTFESIARFRARCLPSSPFCRPRARSSSSSSIFSCFPPPPAVSSASTFSTTLSTLPSDLLYHIRHQHYTRALISSVGNSAFLAISLLLYHPLMPSPTLSPPAPLVPPFTPRALPRFLRLYIPTRARAHRIVYAHRGSTRLEYGCLISLCYTQGARIRRQFLLEVNFAAIECLAIRGTEMKVVSARIYE